MCVCVCVCVCIYIYACVRACVCVCSRGDNFSIKISFCKCLTIYYCTGIKIVKITEKNICTLLNLFKSLIGTVIQRE